MQHLKKLTLLHSNDMHGDFMVENIDEKLVGGHSHTLPDEPFVVNGIPIVQAVIRTPLAAGDWSSAPAGSFPRVFREELYDYRL